MGSYVETKRLVFETLECGGCGLHWGVAQYWLNARRADGKRFYCPNGCPRAYHETEGTQLQRKLLTAQAERDHARNQRDKAEAESAKMTRRLARVEKGVAHGVCPYCPRTITNSRLARHIATKHPDAPK